jgi:hypothetical protein
MKQICSGWALKIVQGLSTKGFKPFAKDGKIKCKSGFEIDSW